MHGIPIGIQLRSHDELPSIQCGVLMELHSTLLLSHNPVGIWYMTNSAEGRRVLARGFIWFWFHLGGRLGPLWAEFDCSPSARVGFLRAF